MWSRGIVKWNITTESLTLPWPSQIKGASVVCSAVCSGADQRKYQSSASRAFVMGIHRSPVDSFYKGPITRNIFPFDDVIMMYDHHWWRNAHQNDWYHTEALIMAQVYRLSAVHCQMTRYSQRVPGYLTRYSCVSQWNLVSQKNQPMKLCLSNQVRPGREWFPSPLGDFNRLFEGLIG